MKWKYLAICLALLLTISVATDTDEGSGETNSDSVEERTDATDETFEERDATDYDLVPEEAPEEEEEEGEYDLTERGGSCNSGVICGRSNCCPNDGYQCRGSSCFCPSFRRCGNRCCRRGFLCRQTFSGFQCVNPNNCDWQLECGQFCCGNEQRCVIRNGRQVCQNSPRNCKYNWYTTYNADQWGGNCPSSRAACWLVQGWNQCFPQGIRFGCPNTGFHLTWRNLTALRLFFRSNPTGGFSALPNDISNPVEGEEFWHNLAALRLNLGFETCRDAFSIGCQSIRDLYVCDHSQNFFDQHGSCRNYYNWKIIDIYNLANRALGGCCFSPGPNSPRCNIRNLNECIMAINDAFLGGRNLDSLYDDEFSSKTCPSRFN